MNEGLFSRYSDIYKHISELKEETTEETAYPKNSVEDLEAISGNIICQGVLRKFRYLQRKMEIENTQKAKSKTRSRKEKACKNASQTLNNFEKNSTKSSKKKLRVTYSKKATESVKFKKPAHTKSNAAKEQTDTPPKELEKKAKVKLEQDKLYDKLLKAAESGESSFCDSDCETENKLFDEVGVANVSYDDKEVKNVPNTVHLQTSQVNQQNCIVKNCQKSAHTSVDANKNPNSRKKLDWPEQLLFLEMAHDDFDKQTHINVCGKNDCNERITEIKPEGLKEAGIHETVEALKDTEGETERNQIMKPKGFKITSKKVKVPKYAKAKKRKKRSSSNEEMSLGEKMLESQVMNIREEKHNRKRSKTSPCPQLKEIESSLEDQDSFDSAIDCSVTNETNNSFTDAKSSKDSGQFLGKSTSCHAKTPCALQTDNKKQSLKKKSKSKRKNDEESLNSFGENANRHSLEVIHDVSSETSLLDLSLPTPRPPRVGSDPFSLSYDGENMDDDECSSDEDLPVGLTPLKIEKTFNENDIVWVKWKKWPHLPALVRRVYKKKRRITCAAFNPDGFEEDFTMGYGNPGSVIPYCDPKKDQILEEAAKLGKDDQAFFRDSCTHAENFLMKEALKGLESTGAITENVHQEDSEVENGIEGKLTVCSKKRKRAESHSDSECAITKVDGKNDGLSKQGQERIERMSKKTKPLTDFLVSETTKEYLQSIFSGNIHSDLHDRFLSGTVRERDKMKHRGFGPIDDDDQIDLLLNTYMKWLTHINTKNIHEINYVFDVWVPEAVVFALKKMKGYNPKRAWEQFNKGVRRTKEELRIIHKDMIDVETSRKQISDKPTDFILM